MQNDVLVIGLGGVGRSCFEFLSKNHTVRNLIGADVNEKSGKACVNIATAGALNLGYNLNTDFKKIDLLDEVDKNAEILRKINPRIILNCTTMMTWWLLESKIPHEVLKPLEEIADLGPWIPQHLRLTCHLMKAVREAGIDSHVVNGSFSDSVGPALKTKDLAPTIGMGNLDSEVTFMRMIVAKNEGLRPKDINIYAVGHHFNVIWMEKGDEEMVPPPYYLKIFAGHRDVTSKYDIIKLQKEAGRMWGGDIGDSLTAASQCKNALAILNDEYLRTTAPSPNGMVGAYPVILKSDGPELDLPDDITLDEAVNINLEGQRRDGIEEIREDGEIIFPDNVVEIVNNIFHFKCKSFNVDEVDEVAIEQKNKVNELISKYS